MKPNVGFYDTALTAGAGFEVSSLCWRMTLLPGETFQAGVANVLKQTWSAGQYWEDQSTHGEVVSRDLQGLPLVEGEKSFT